MNESILIVDDEKEIADLIEVYLKNDGYDFGVQLIRNAVSFCF